MPVKVIKVSTIEVKIEIYRSEEIALIQGAQNATLIKKFTSAVYDFIKPKILARK